MAQNSLTLGRWAYFRCLSSIPAVYMSSFILVPLLFWWPLLYFCNKFWNQGVWVLQFCSFYSRMLRLFEGPCNYRCIWELAFLFLKKKKWNFLTDYITMGGFDSWQYCVPGNEYGVSFHLFKPLVYFSNVL